MKLLLILIAVISISSLYSVELTYERFRNNLRGLKEYEQGNPEEALKYFERNVIDNPGKGELHFNLGNSYYRLGELDKAINEYQRALRDDSFANQSNAWHNIGNSLFEQQEYEKALEMYRNAIITDSENFDARYNYELTAQMLDALQPEDQPQSDQSDDKQQQQQQQTMPAEETEEPSDDQAEAFKQEEADNGDDEQESQFDREGDIQDAQDILRTLLSREREIIEEEKEHARRELELRGRFW